MTAGVQAAAGRAASIDGALRAIAIALSIAMVAQLTFVPLSQNDFWLQSAIGRLIMQTGQIPGTVLFPFTWARDFPFNAHEWLPSIAFHWLHETLGYDHLLFVQGALGLGLFALSVALAFRVGARLGVALACGAIAMLVANYRHYLRPELVVLLLFVAQFHVLALYRQRRRWPVLLLSVPLAVLWANSHGSFLLGPIVAAIFAVGEGIEAWRHAPRLTTRERWRHGVAGGAPYALAAAAMLAASMLNPLGAELLRFALTLSASEVTKTFVREWNPTFSPVFIGEPGFFIFLGAAAASLATMALSWRRLTATDVLLLAAFLVLACLRMRYVVWFGFVALMVCARLLGAVPWRAWFERAALGVSLAISVAGLALSFEHGNAYGAYPYMAASSAFTLPMIEQLSRDDVKGNVLNSYELGAELIYRYHPKLQPSIDSRIDSYGDHYFLLHQKLLRDESLLLEFVDDFDVRYMLLMWRDFEALRAMGRLRQSWVIQFADQKAVLLARRSPPPPPQPAH
ncbi:MAG TPA: hypothetical protein VLJ86_25515 [Ramlibacter sp.]|nr:hypothetical protein [Ramlibacter sp.]